MNKWFKKLLSFNLCRYHEAAYVILTAEGEFCVPTPAGLQLFTWAIYWLYWLSSIACVF